MSQSTNPPSRTSRTGATGASNAVAATSSGAGARPTEPEVLGARARESASEITAQAKESALEAVDDAIAGVKGQASALLERASDALDDARGTAHEALGGAHATGGGARYGLVETIKVNPFPALLAGLGLGWLFMQSRGAGQRGVPDAHAREAVYREHYPVSPAPTGASSAYGAYQGSGNAWAGRSPVGSTVARAQAAAGEVGGAVSDAAGQVGDLAGRAGGAVGDAVGQVGETAGNLAGQVGETASAIVGQVGETAGNIASGTMETAGNIAGQAQYQATRLEDGFQRALRESPLAVGAVTLALGTAVGLALPGTARENQLMGEARDSLLERAQDFAQETVEKVQGVAAEVTETVTETAKTEAKKQGLT